MSMLWENELRQLLTELGVVQEREDEGASPREEPSSEVFPDFTVYQRSSSHPGVFYRIDLFGVSPELLVYVPCNLHRTGLKIYHVFLSPGSPLASQYVALETMRGSFSFDQVRDMLSYHMLLAFAELLKALFWQGDLHQMLFPREITVEDVTDPRT